MATLSRLRKSLSKAEGIQKTAKNGQDRYNAAASASKLRRAIKAKRAQRYKEM